MKALEVLVPFLGTSQLDYTRTFLGGQSGGAHIALEYLNYYPKCDNFLGLAFVSPVDSTNPFRIKEPLAITVNTNFRLQMPLLIIRTEFDEVPGT